MSKDRLVVDLASTNPRQAAAAADQYVRRLARAAMLAADQTALDGRQKIRATMASQRLARFRGVVQYTSDQKKNRGATRNLRADRPWRVGSAVFTNFRKSERAAGAWSAYTTGPVIIPRKGKWLAFPTENAPKKIGRKKATPALYRAAGEPLGPLQFVPGKNPGIAYLIANDVTVPGNNKSGKASRSNRGGRVKRAFVVVFILIKRTRRNVRLRPIDIVRQTALKLPRRIEQNADRRQTGSGPGAIRSAPIFRSGGSGGGRFF